jgi:hypothetical protein
MLSAHKKLRIIVGGMVGQYPFGGVAWDYFHYCLALHELGHDVYYHEDTWCWPYDPVAGSVTDKPDHTVAFIRDFFDTHAPHLSHKWHYLLLHEKSFGMTRQAFDEVAQTADVFLNVSGACFFPDHLNPRCLKVFMDTDPGYNQFVLSEKYAWSQNVERWCKQVADHDRHLTYAENIYGDDCVIPRMDFDWQPTRCVVTLPSWAKVRNEPIPKDAAFTTVMTLGYFRGKVMFHGRQYDSKVPEFQKFLNLPRQTNMPLALAIAGDKVPLEPIRQAGWQLLDGVKVTLTTEGYMRFLAESAGEWSIAKNVYVDTHSGWFSCRTACYLAAGRPAVVQETAWSRFIPSGSGVIAFGTMDEAIEGLRAVTSEPAKHRAAAYEIAREYLAADRVIPPMLEAIFAVKREKPIKPGAVPPSLKA